MKVVWVINITMPEVCTALGRPMPVIGGWLVGYRDALLSHYPNVELHIVEPYWGAKERTLSLETPIHAAGGCSSNQTITHHLFPSSWLNSNQELSTSFQPRLSAASNRMVAHFCELNDSIQPDVVHLHGTEFPHAFAWIEANGTEHTIASIQGLAFEYAKVFMSGLSAKQQRPSLSDCRHGFSLAKEQDMLARRGDAEVALLQRIEHIAGRTTWDHDCTLAINGQLNYHVLQEVLRQEFYSAAGSWKIQECQPHTLFVSQSHYPIKGLHKLLEALPAVIARYPDTQVRIVGNDHSAKHWWQRSTYGNVLHRLIQEHRLSGHLCFLGAQTAQQMVDEYQKANVFVCPSRIENSCNSVCEAQLIGTPVVAACVGGMESLIEHKQTGMLYGFEDTTALADSICQLFASTDQSMKMSQAGILKAQQRHDPEAIAHSLYNIYQHI